MSNLLSKPALLEAKETGQVYVVWDGKDYRMTLATLVSLVSKATLGLDRVNNTPDSEKPISNPVSIALQAKANSDAVVSKDEFELLVQSLSNFVSQEQLTQSVGILTTALENYATKEALQQALTTATQPINQALEQISLTLTAHAGRLQTLETATGYVSVEQMNQALATLSQSLNVDIGVIRQEVTNGFDEVNDRLSLFQAGLDSLSQALDGHIHTVNQIEGLREFVVNVIQEEKELFIGPNEW